VFNDAGHAAARAASAVSIARVETAADRRRFLSLPRAMYADDPAWVAPLAIQAREQIDPRHPFFEHAEIALFLAWRDGRPVGRISAQIDRLFEAHHGVRAGFFGLLEAEDDQAVFDGLLEAASRWLRERGCTRLMGPFNLNINQELGLLVAGFDTPPCFMMGHARRWYAPRLEAAGLAPVKDLLAYQITPAFEPPPLMQRLVRRLEGYCELRPLDRRVRDADIERMREVFNDAWSQNWGFVPFTEAEFHRIGGELVRLLPDDFIQIAEVEGRAAGFIVLLPNLNEAIADLDGRLLPHGWAKLLWRLFVRHPRTGRVPLMGVRRSYQQTPLGVGLASTLIDAARTAAQRKRMAQLELSWVLEDNVGMRAIIESIGGRVRKRYRIYERALGEEERER